MSSIAIMPDGRRVFLSNSNDYIAQNNGVAFTKQDGSQTFYLLQGGGGILAAQFMVLQLDAIVAADNHTPTVVNEPFYTVSSITPTSFDITTATLTIRGTGFVSGTLGTLRFEDAVGDPDSNGYYHTLTYVSPTTLTSTYGGPGDGDLGPGAVIIYYEDSNGFQSNLVAATNPSGTLITIP